MRNVDVRQHAIVTGAASGLGRALSVELGKRGWHVALADVNDAGSAETLQQLRAAGGDGQVEHLDVTRVEAWQTLRDKLQASWPALDLLINNAGVGCAGNVGELPLDDWQWIININLNGAIYGCHTMIDWMKQNPRGAHIVNVASMAAVVSSPGMAPYNVTKAAVVSLSETLAGELRPHNIGATAVLPAFFPTRILENGRFHKPNQRQVANTLMSHSRASAEDVARKVLHAVDRNQLYVFAPGVATLFWRLKRMIPRTLLRFVAGNYHTRLDQASEQLRRDPGEAPRENPAHSTVEDA